MLGFCYVLVPTPDGVRAGRLLHMLKYESSPETERQLRIEKKKAEHAEAYPNEISAYHDVDVQCGTVKDCSATNPRERLAVPTDSAAVFSRDHHVASGIFYGCGALVLTDGTRVLFAHMTPGNRMQYLGWQLEKGDPVNREYVDASLADIIAAARAAGMDQVNIKFQLIAEPGISRQDPKAPLTKYSIESTDASLQHVQDVLASQGIPGEIVKSAVSGFTVIIDPEEQGIFVSGYANAYENGVLVHKQQKENVKTLFFPLLSPRKKS